MVFVDIDHSVNNFGLIYHNLNKKAHCSSEQWAWMLQNGFGVSSNNPCVLTRSILAIGMTGLHIVSEYSPQLYTKRKANWLMAIHILATV